MSNATIAAWILAAAFLLLAIVMTMVGRAGPSHKTTGMGTIIVHYVDGTNGAAGDGGGAGGSSPNPSAEPSEPPRSDQTQEPGQEQSAPPR